MSTQSVFVPEQDFTSAVSVHFRIALTKADLKNWLAEQGQPDFPLSQVVTSMLELYVHEWGPLPGPRQLAQQVWDSDLSATLKNWYLIHLEDCGYPLRTFATVLPHRFRSNLVRQSLEQNPPTDQEIREMIERFPVTTNDFPPPPDKRPKARYDIGVRVPSRLLQQVRKLGNERGDILSDVVNALLSQLIAGDIALTFDAPFPD